MKTKQEITKNVLVDEKIFIIRGMQVMVDKDLAELYQVETRSLNQAIKRNIDRFPSDFMFQLTKDEYENLISQNVISRWGGIRKMPFAFTQDGIAMLSSVLKSKIAIHINIQIMRTFTRLKNQSVPYFDIIKRLESLETDNKDTKQLLNKVVEVVTTMQEIQNEANTNTRQIGFRTN